MANLTTVPEELFVALATVKPFLDTTGRVFFRDGQVHTTTENEVGASYAVPGIGTDGIYNLKMLSLLEPVAKQIDFTCYPEPLLFYGERLRGAIIGQRT